MGRQGFCRLYVCGFGAFCVHYVTMGGQAVDHNELLAAVPG